MYTTDHIFTWMLITGLLLADHYIEAQVPLNMDNVAVHGQCNQSSYYTETGKHTNQCNCAINGNTGYTFVQDDCSSTGNCIHSGLSDSTPYWTVYLNQTFVIQKITVYGRDGNFGLARMGNIAVLVNQTEVYRFRYPQTPDIVTDINAQVSGSALPVRGRDVTLSRSAGLPSGANIDLWDGILLNICEVQVWVCKVGHYGSGSACIPCRTECQNSVCDDIRYPNTCRDYDPCNSKPCDNGGSCQRNTGDNPHSFTCHCPAGYTGWNCSTEINECKPDPCVNGTCEDLVAGYNCTCHEGYSGVNCNIDIDDCVSKPCLHGNCEDLVANYVCNCYPGYNGDNCSINIDECASNPCVHGNCNDKVNSYQCNCESGFEGSICNNTATDTNTSSSSQIAIGVGVGVGGGVVVIVIIVVILILIRRRQHKKPRSNNNRTIEGAEGPYYDINGTDNSVEQPQDNRPKITVRPFVQEPSPKSDDLGKHTDAATSKDHLYGNLAPASSKENQQRNLSPRSSGDDKETTKQTAPAPLPSKPLVAAKPGKLVAVVSAVNPTEYANVQYPKSKTVESGKPKPPADSRSDASQKRNSVGDVDESSDDELAVEEEDVYNGSLYAWYSTLQKTVSILDDFQKWLLDRINASEILENEFEEFPKGMPYSHSVGLDPKNNRKNRFQKLCAYDKNRVVLKRPKKDPDTDYINASWIKGPENERSYIATQGPRVNCVSDLWLMVWEESVTQIVMLTNLKEDGKDKCEEYWPEVGSTTTYGHVVVTSQSVEERADFIIRTFVIYPKGAKPVERLVYQYHYVAWPDHGVPEAGSLVHFWRYVTARAGAGAPPVIHCSAGVGRTGTYIALDLAMGRKSRGNDVKVFDMVMKLREQRSIMVQTLVQYKFLHEVILEAYTSRNSRLTAEQLDLRFPSHIDVNTSNKIIDSEFKLLAEMKTWAKPRHQAALMAENRDKNRDQDVLPDDDFMPYLSVHVKGRNQYINATYLSSFTKRHGLLLTQLPLPHTLVDLWRLVEGCDVTTILSLGAKDDDKTVKGFCKYWPRVPDEELTFDPYELTLNSLLRVNSNLTTYSVNMKGKDKIAEVKIVHYTDWSGEVPGSISDVIYLVNLVRAASEESHAPVLIQCLDGANRSGLFCILFDVMCRMTKDAEVSIFPTVRHVQCVRRTAVTSEKQYRYLYRAAQEFRQSQSVYANT